ncbi:penicillin-binding protein activator [Roseobacter sinensis]|uniref:Penicillin-binding protein activator n=1 Tax=Roseobacter sinensis TaxID=2931391 RepID=A0ABT3BCY4_9RHOB|nr:penicillin-binding protein activator [Roseobacter sp. WL0113]MCV3271420.1 penicillin-binding protein activator [Roseobacter sp. WL0113]
MFAVFPSARKAAHLIALPLVALLLAACDTLPGAGFGGGPSINTGEAVPVALLVPSGSGQTTDEILAQSLENSARLAMRDLNGASVDLRVYQTAGDAATAAARAQQAVDEGAKIILGPVYAASANAVGNAVAGDGITVLSFSNNAAIAGGNVFVLGQTFQNTADRMVSYARGQGKSRFVIVHGQDSAGTQGRDAINNAVNAQGGSVVGTVGYALSQQDVIASIPQIKSAVEGNAADAVFMTTDTASALPLLSQLLPEAGISSQTAQFMGLTRWDIPPQTLSLPGVQGGWFAGPDPAASATFSAQYQNAYGSLPHPIGGLAFDGVAAIGALVSQGNPNALTPAALTQGAGFRGASGIFRLRPDGTNERGLAVATINNAQVTIVSPAPQSFGGAGF